MIQLYNEYVNDLAKKSSEDISHTSDPEHEAIMIFHLLSSAKKEIRIGCDGMYFDTNYDAACLGAFSTFLENGGLLYILFHGYNIDVINTEMWMIIEPYIIRGQVEIKYNNEKKFTRETLPVSFIIIDDKAFHFKFDIDNNFTKSCFNAPNKCNNLIELFNKAFNDEFSETLKFNILF